MRRTISKSFYLVIPSTRRYRGAPPELLQPKVLSDKTVPKVKPGEVAIKCNVELPLSLFEEPQFKATIRVAENAVTPQQVDAEVIDNIEQIVAESTGLVLTIMTDEENDGDA